MAKRNRGTSRPGQRRPSSGPVRPSTRPAARPSSSLSEDEEARAAEIESRIVAQERAAESTRARSRQVASRPAEARRAGGQGLLAVRAAEEYNYVVRDVRRILVVGGSLAGILAVLFVLIDILKVITIS
jgi:hypothetical protein